MEPEIVKNTLQTVIHFLDWDKHIDLQNDPGIDLEFFLKELNRHRATVGLTLYRKEKTMPMTGRGDWFGRGEKVRFVQNQRAHRQKISPNISDKSEDKANILKVAHTPVKKITKTQLEEKLKSVFNTFSIHESKNNGKKTYQYEVDGIIVGEWSKGRGWFAEKAV